MLSRSRSNLPSQLDFSFLSVPHLQSVVCAQVTGVDPEALVYTGSSSSNKEAWQEDERTCMKFNSNAPLSAVEKSTAYDVNIQDAGATKPDSNANVHELIALDGRYDPERVLRFKAPPKRFYRTFWRSISLRLLRQREQGTTLSFKSGPMPSRQVC
jgi:hypothetical protein